MQLEHYLNSSFPNLKLRPPLFYNWELGIRFELGDPNEEDIKNYMERVYSRATTLFKALHSAKDEIIIVANIHHDGEENLFRRRKIKTFQHYIKSKKVLYRLQHNVIPYVFEDVYDIYDFETHRFALNCQVADVKYANLIKAICNQDMGIKPKISHDVFFVNLSKNSIFHIYDDRGCDVIASSKESIRFLYEQYNNWILKYDEEAIDRLFLN
ncbi:DUF3885 domain-containing protein [Brevibacillus sp. B_LB10_24]|uniref:DUF3885 domain-containing protein n=1 Tax=Brevibacillus sp. B_LB10_24 TaxID=3380645 RepID=UPI0038BD5382